MSIQSARAASLTMSIPIQQTNQVNERERTSRDRDRRNTNNGQNGGGCSTRNNESHLIESCMQNERAAESHDEEDSYFENEYFAIVEEILADPQEDPQ